MKKLNFSTGQFTKIFSYGEKLRPGRDWIMVLLIAVLLVALSALWNAWLFYESFSGKQIGAAPVASSTAATIPVQNISEVQSVFQDRATEEQNYQKNYKFVDPSVAGS